MIGDVQPIKNILALVYTFLSAGESQAEGKLRTHLQRGLSLEPACKGEEAQNLLAEGKTHTAGKEAKGLETQSASLFTLIFLGRAGREDSALAEPQAAFVSSPSHSHLYKAGIKCYCSCKAEFSPLSSKMRALHPSDEEP